MKPSPLLVIVPGYGLAGACALLLFLSGGGLAWVVATVWLGGAAATLALATVSSWRASARTDDAVAESDLHDSYAAALLQWEQDRNEDVAPQRRRDAS